MATKITKLVVHHSASPRDTTTRDMIDRWHKERKFNQIGYHQVIEGNGRIVAGRPESIEGAHAKGANHGSLGVCVVGNFENEQPNEMQITSLVKVLAGWCKTHGLSQDDIYGHYNVPGGTTATACPGKNLKSQLAAIKTFVKQRLAKQMYIIESRIKDPTVRSAVRKALSGDSRFSYDDVILILRSAFDRGGVTGQELQDIQMILKQAKTLDVRSKQLISRFLQNPASVQELVFQRRVLRA